MRGVAVTRWEGEAPRVLVIGADEPAREVVKALLFAVGVRTPAQASNLTEALQHMAACECDVALIDCERIDERWLTLVEALRASARARHVPVLMLTSRSERPMLRAAKAAGVDGVVMKPIAPKSLKRRMAASVRRAGGGYVLLDVA